MQHLARDHVSQSGHRIRYTANQMAVNSITQCFQYNRTDQMVSNEDCQFYNYLLLGIVAIRHSDIK